jgi:hypothetical protein
MFSNLKENDVNQKYLLKKYFISSVVLTISKHLLVHALTPRALQAAGSSCSFTSAAYPVGCLLLPLVIWLLRNTPQVQGVF